MEKWIDLSGYALPPPPSPRIRFRASVRPQREVSPPAARERGNSTARLVVP